ncbi:ADP-ribose pyrophosphatase [Photobacterium frigidiphilum]|uniref:GDP-mannose pyrophosphatase n=1 Tax=Photobacterium frigidiphilum TaxID=264736 RepID=A0A2T3JEN2_9GAMM|nr:NUDIX hydrolase [Photobacterium frigidiphilum]PSU47377.1 ADP-ribose pyrophosphatase [Photobacterium frigidiphilum]
MSTKTPAKTLYQWKCFSIEQEQHQLPDGRNIEFTTVKHPGAVIIVPINQCGELVLVHQYRPAIKQWILEFPAGTLESKEDILNCAKRELAEEVNLKAESWQSLGELLPVPGFCDEVQYLFLAQGLSETAGELDDDEVIEVVTMSVNEFEQKVLNNEIQDGKTLATYLKIKMMGIV